MSKRSDAHAARLQNDGLKRLAVWVPDDPDAIESLKKSARRLRKKYKTPLPTER